jgi:hypothetical protein
MGKESGPMRRLLRAVVLLGVSVAAPGPAYPQKATEQFIPLGQSPGVSGKVTWIGEVVGTDTAQRTLSIDGAQGAHTAKITEKTRIFLDRSKLKQSNLTGTIADLQKGRRVEVKYEGPGPTPAADWVKVEIARP